MNIVAHWCHYGCGKSVYINKGFSSQRQRQEAFVYECETCHTQYLGLFNISRRQKYFVEVYYDLESEHKALIQERLIEIMVL
jgi:hypothetical protein